MSDDGPSCCFDEWAAYNAGRARKKGIAAPITRSLMQALRDTGLDGRTVLDVGCGTGDLALAAVAGGAARATGVDLGPGAIDQARALASERGLADRTTFLVGDGAKTALPPSDVVILNRVVCCYPNADGLLANTLGAAGSVFTYTAPVDRGPIGALNRAITAIWNAWYALRDPRYQGFRTYVHELERIDARIEAAGFRPRRRERRRLVWQLAVFERS
jgi:magnesium-protoporphyrin O-methyltransferase